jgi:Zn-dependent protease
VHAEEIGRLAAEAEREETARELVKARDFWRRAHDLLPVGSRQSDAVVERIAALNRAVEADPKAASEAEAMDRPAWARRLGLLGIVALFAVTKGKFLLLGLTKSGTFLSMMASFGVYWAAWGWKFALGLVASIYVHEMGHVAAMRRYGIEATAPMFLPGVGAMVRSKQYPVDPVENARVALAGPLWGLGAALAAYAGFWITQLPVLAAVAQVAAWINLFNLLSVPPLDGGKAFSALTEGQRSSPSHWR